MHISVRVHKEIIDKLKALGVGYTEVFNKGLSFYLNDAGTDQLKDSVMSSAVYTKKENFLYAKALISEYGCGCPKEDKKVLCVKHGRY